MDTEDYNDEIVPLFTCDCPGIVHGSLTRHGGCSGEPFDTNNLSFGVGDNRRSVADNRERIIQKFGVTTLASAKQVHGDTICRVEKEEGNKEIRFEDCDAMLTNLAGVGLMIGHADCQAVVFFDPVKKVIAAAHSGWRGSVLNIAAKTVAAMEKDYNCRAGDIRAGISPSLGPCCAEFVNFRKELPPSFWKFQVKDNYFDFWQITRNQLQEFGIARENISASGICTSCSADYYSYRRACREGDGTTGRNGSVIALVKE